jgi:hypothetical protein
LFALNVARNNVTAGYGKRISNVLLKTLILCGIRKINEREMETKPDLK